MAGRLLYILLLVLCVRDRLVSGKVKNSKWKRDYIPTQYQIPYYLPYNNNRYYERSYIYPQQTQYYFGNMAQQGMLSADGRVDQPFSYKQYQNSETINGEMKSFSKAVVGSKRSIGQPTKSKKMTVQPRNTSESLSMINIPFKTKSHGKKRTMKKTQQPMKKFPQVGERRNKRINKVTRDWPVISSHSAFILRPTSSNKHLRVQEVSGKRNVTTTHSQNKAVNLNQINKVAGKKNVTTNSEIINENEQIYNKAFLKRNNSTRNKNQKNLSVNKLTSTNNTPLVKSTNQTVKGQTKVFQGIMKGIKNFTNYLFGPKDKGKQPSNQASKNVMNAIHYGTPPDLKHDAVKEDWFGIDDEPDSRTQNDLKISKNKFFDELVSKKMTGKSGKKEKVKDNKANIENHVKKLVDLVELTEHEELKNIVQDSMGSPLKGELKRLPVNPENAKAAEKEKNAYVGATESNEIKKLITDYKDDFDVFVDKEGNRASYTPPVNKDTMVDHAVDSASDIESQYVGKDVEKKMTGNDINAVTSSDRSNLKEISTKWKAFKDAHKELLNEEKEQLLKDEAEISNEIPVRSNGGKKDQLDQYFFQVEQMEQKEKMNNRQKERRHKINATLNMLTDIEHQIDGIIGGGKREKKGKANMFREMVSDGIPFDSLQNMGMQTTENEQLDGEVHLSGIENMKTMVQDDDIVEKNDAFNLQNSEGSPRVSQVSISKQPIEFSPQSATNQQIVDAQRANTLPQVTQETSGNTQTVAETQQASNSEPIDEAEPQQTQEIQTAQQKDQLIQQVKDSGNDINDQKGPIDRNLASGEAELVQKIQKAPLYNNQQNGKKLIDDAVSSSDNVDRMLQAKTLKNIQSYEMTNDLRRMKEVTQNGLMEMFNTAVNKQQNFINNVQNGEESQFTPPVMSGSQETPGFLPFFQQQTAGVDGTPITVEQQQQQPDFKEQIMYPGNNNPGAITGDDNSENSPDENSENQETTDTETTPIQASNDITTNDEIAQSQDDDSANVDTLQQQDITNQMSASAANQVESQPVEESMRKDELTEESNLPSETTDGTIEGNNVQSFFPQENGRNEIFPEQLNFFNATQGGLDGDIDQ